jgi:hypothetical protein
MSYTIQQTDGTPLIVLADGVVNSDKLSISLIGKNVSNFGDAQNENFVHMLENFARSTQPTGDLLKGQIWYNSSSGVSRPLVFDGVNWRPLAVLLSHNTTTNDVINGAGADLAASRPGDLWFDSGKKQLHVVTAGGESNATETILIGPEIVDGFDTSKFQSVKMIDNAGGDHPVMQMTLNGEIIGMISRTTFTPGTTSTVAGFSKVYRGITFKNYNSSTRYTTATTDVQLYGLHEQLDPTVVRRNVSEHILSNWYFDNGTVLNFGTTGQSSVSWNTVTSNLLLTSTSGIRLQSASTSITFNGTAFTASADTVDLGSTSTRYNTVYTKTLNATTISAATVTADVINGLAIYDGGARALTTATIGDFGTQFIKGTTNQIAVTPSTGTVTISLPDVVEIKQLQGGGVGNAGSISGTWTLTPGSTLQATYADLAECYQADVEYSPGTVLEFGGEFEVTVAEDSTRRVAGVVSTAPAYLMNRQLMGKNVAVIALTGRVPCKVRGRVRKGDMMVSAGSGFARAEYSPILGSVIGKALEDFDGLEGVIEVVVGRL